MAKVVLVLGAGASLANARYFRPERSQDTHPPLDATFFQKIRVRDVPLPPALRVYLRGLLGADPTPRLLEGMKMEEFFKDVYYDFVTEEDSVPTRQAYVDLVGVYTRVLRETTNWLCEDSRTGAPVGRLIAAAADHTDAVTVITFNHDLVIENEIFKRSRLRARWCIEKSYGSISDTMTTLRSGVFGSGFSSPWRRLLARSADQGPQVAWLVELGRSPSRTVPVRASADGTVGATGRSVVATARDHRAPQIHETHQARKE